MDSTEMDEMIAIIDRALGVLDMQFGLT
jgi:hypothetical protein